MKYLLAFLIPVAAYGQTTYYSNQYGQSVGSSYVVGNTTYYSNQYGQPVGSASTLNPPTYNSTPSTQQVPSVPHTVLDSSATYGYTPVPVLPQLPMLPMLPMLGATR